MERGLRRGGLRCAGETPPRQPRSAGRCGTSEPRNFWPFEKPTQLYLFRLPTLPFHFAHQGQQIVFGVAEEGHPEVVVGHAGDHVRLVFETNTFLF
jgi:hypothetical protein